MSHHSAGPVAADEQIARFFYYPMQINKNNRVIAGAFSHALSKGCSVQRETKASDAELSEHVTSFLNGGDDRKWCAVVIGNAQVIRNLEMEGFDGRLMCVYDPGEPTNPAHAEICATRIFEDDGSANEFRRVLGIAFNADRPLSPASYRGGEVMRLLGPEHRARGSTASATAMAATPAGR